MGVGVIKETEAAAQGKSIDSALNVLTCKPHTGKHFSKHRSFSCVTISLRGEVLFFNFNGCYW